MGGKNDAPDYPKELMREQLALSEAQANRFFNMSEEQQQWSRDMWENEMLPSMQGISNTQRAVMEEQLANARKDRERYESVYQPLEDSLITEFQEYDSPERRGQESARAQAAVQQAWTAQRNNAEQRLSGYGVDPSQIKSGALDLSARVRVAAAQAQAGTDARRRVEDTGRALRAEAINIGRGMPSQVAASYGQTLNAGNSAQGNVNSTVGQGGNLMGTGQGWGQMGGNQLSSTMSGINNMYSGQLSGYDASGGTMGALGNIAGQAFGAWAGSGFAEGGGAVGGLPNDNYTAGASAEGGGQAALPLQDSDLSSVPGPNDNIPVTLAQDEYIIPKDVVMRMGTEKLDKLIESTRQKAGETGGANANTPVGEMPNPEPPIKGQTLAAQGGGAVGSIPPMAVQAQPMVMNMQGAPGDPFADYRANKAAQAQQQAIDFESAIASGAAMRENYDTGEGLPGKLKAWLDKRSGLDPDSVAAYKKQARASGADARAIAPSQL